METDSMELVRLGDVLPRSYKNGIYKSAECYGHGVPILRITDFDNDGCLVTENLQKLELDEKEVSSYELGANDIVVNRVNSLTHLGKAILWTDTKTRTVYESNMMRIEPDEAKVHPQYLIRILQSYEARVHFKKVAKRAVAQCSINQQDVKALRFRLPPLPEQKKIAQILSTWDKAITTTEQLLANSQQQKKALMQQLLTGKKRLLDDNGVRFSGEWRHGHLSDLGKITKGKALSSKDLIVGNYPVIAGGKSSPYNHRDYTHENVITVSASGAYAGYVAYHPYKLWASDCSVVMGKPNSNIGFIYQLMSHMQSKIYSLQSGGAQPHVYPKDLEVLRVSIPPVDEQQKIAAVLSTADQEITALQQKLDAIMQEKKALMQQLLTGKRRVLV